MENKKNEIVAIKDSSIGVDMHSRDEIKVILSNNLESDYKGRLKAFIEDLSGNESLFKYSIYEQLCEGGLIEITISCVFDTNYIHMVCSDIDMEISYTTKMIDALSNQKCLSSVTQSIFDKRIDDITLRNEELKKQEKILKMQLFNAIDKRNQLVKKITDFINVNLPGSAISYVSATNEIEKAFMDMSIDCGANLYKL